MSLYRRKNSPYWYYDFRRAGVRYTGTTGTADKRAATRIERDLVASVEAAGGAPASDAPTVGALFLKYFLSHASHLPSVKTIEAHFIALQTRLDLDMLASELSNAHVSAYVADRRSDVSPATVNRELATLRAAHRMAAEAWEWSVRPIAWRRHMLKEPQGRTRWITTEEATRLIRALPPHLADAVEWSLLTGCRRGETFDLDWARVDLNNRVVRVFGKGAKWRNVYLSKQAFLLLANLPGDQTGLVVLQIRDTAHVGPGLRRGRPGGLPVARLASHVRDLATARGRPLSRWLSRPLGTRVSR